MLMPKKVKYRKQQRGRMTGKAWRGPSNPPAPVSGVSTPRRNGAPWAFQSGSNSSSALDVKTSR